MMVSYAAPIDTQASQALDDDVENETTEGVFNGNPSFVPEGSINKLLNSSRVHSIVPDISQLLQDYVCQDAKKIFLILQEACPSCNHISGCLKSFLDRNLSDKDLPLEDFRRSGKCRSLGADYCTHKPKLDVFHNKNWTSRAIRNFLDKQWKFTAHVFKKGAEKAELPSKCILPFTSRGADKSGTFGTDFDKVSSTKPSTGSIHVALKQLRNVSDDSEYNVGKAWELEANALFTTRSLKSRHLVRIICAFRQSLGHGQGEKYYLLLEWAQGGNLKEFWKNDGTERLSNDQIRQYLQQLLGLCEALEELHKDGAADRGTYSLSPHDPHHHSEGHVRHGDLKAANILIFPDKTSKWLGVLKIADLGLAKSHFQKTALRTQETRTKEATQQYLAPEMAINPKRKRSRVFDIWSMGCIIFESVLWLLYGKEGLNKFWAMSAQLQNPEKDSLFFNILPTRKAQVSKLFLSLTSQITTQDPLIGQSPTVIGDLVELVRDKLLVVDPDARSKAKELRERMQAIVRQTANPEYLTTADRKRRGRDQFLTVGSSQTVSAYPNQQVRPPPSTLLQKQPFHLFMTIQLRSLCPESILVQQELMDNKTNAKQSEIKVGLPRLPAPGSSAFFDLIRHWIVSCDEQHPKCKSRSPSELKRLPTRLIDVGSERGPGVIYLRQLSSEDRQQPERFNYTALSHRWGDGRVHRHFSTTTDNVDCRRKGIPVDSLPRTFRDAVTVTRQLGVRYLWIDSICIIQEGDLRDFETEAKHMETVFHLAYVVIAASRTTGTSDGFLGGRPEREFAALPISAGYSTFACENIDNFQHQIVEDEMNKRGWVLQERALARRTIYFGGVQTYWECGEGVRCETLTKMKNNKEEFLGDPNFPDVALNSTKGGRIRLVESLYKQYSTLEFTRDYDRPLAIAGLEQRLIRAFNTKGGYGVCQLYLGRTLLWKRGQSTTLRKIDFPPEQKFQVPSWSWMAYNGNIDFVDAPFDEVDWSENLESPWVSASQWTSSTGDSTSSNVLHAIAWDFDEGKGGSGLTYDYGAPPTGSVVKCVIVGKEKRKGAAAKHQQRHFVLIVTPRAAARKPDEYVRIGAGILPLGSIDQAGAVLDVKIS
ncbi:hypothetical protein FDECE_9525 [Fusarium decemcellulare]|nr:hypothetical protein FDECE_9525 [Fusarium decemcellulare]